MVSRRARSRSANVRQPERHPPDPQAALSVRALRGNADRSLAVEGGWGFCRTCACAWQVSAPDGHEYAATVPSDMVAERARFELANGGRPLRHFQCRALDQTRRPLRSESILSAVPPARTASLAGRPTLEIEGGGDHREVRQRL